MSMKDTPSLMFTNMAVTVFGLKGDARWADPQVFRVGHLVEKTGVYARHNEFLLTFLFDRGSAWSAELATEDDSMKILGEGALTPERVLGVVTRLDELWEARI